MTRVSILILYLFIILHLVSAEVMLIGNNTYLSFDDVQASFTPTIKNADRSGVLYAAEPLDACSDLVNTVVTIEQKPNVSSYVLIIRGGCSFEDKIRNAQKAGFTAAIVYDNEDYGLLISMAGNPSGVLIYGTFVSKSSGEVLKKYVGRTDLQLRLIPSFETSALSIMAISFTSLLAMSAVLATCFFVRRRRVRRRRLQSLSMEFPRIPVNTLRSMPTTIFNGVSEGASTSFSCAICIEDYQVGDKLRILPCRHKFHVGCVDLWLGQRKSFCPVCKRDARTVSIDMPASEHTPLLSPRMTPTPTSSFLLSSPSTTPLQSSYDLPISDSPSRSTTMQPHTIPMYLSHSRSHASFQNGSNRHSPAIPVSRSSVDLSSQRSYNSPHQGSLTRTLHSRYTQRLSSGNTSRSWVVGSLLSQRGGNLHLNGSNRPFCHFSSASSLPGC